MTALNHSASHDDPEEPAMTETINPKTAKLLPSVRTRTTAQLIREHAMAEAMTGGDASDVAAWILVLSAIETVLGERGVPMCADCGTPSSTHADYCALPRA